MIAVLFAASLAQMALPDGKSGTVPCHAVPGLCMTSEQQRSVPLAGRAGPTAGDVKMSAYRVDARPCRMIGNLGCPKQARFQFFRLGEPIRETLLRTFLPR